MVDARIIPDAPWLVGYANFLRGLGDGHPSIAQLNALLPAGVVSGGGAAIRFRASEKIPGVEYERHVFETGEVSTRANEWHDVFNALAWCRWPRLKAALNAAHYRSLDEARGGRRGARRDALTLLDESGALVVSGDRGLLEALAARDWQRAFVARREAWAGSRCLLCGHALLQKLRAPYRAITAHALLLQVDRRAAGEWGESFLQTLDAWLAAALAAGGICGTPADLSPLPLAGIPGWWASGPQDAAFYANAAVFRSAPADHVTAPLWRVRPDADRLLY
ncbi:MAG: DUF3025 domain-containing protein [Xanthomonadales bacterium]|nr:DUF3025 domain-containing protein [Xanthomonadales bacterium]